MCNSQFFTKLRTKGGTVVYCGSVVYWPTEWKVNHGGIYAFFLLILIWRSLPVPVRRWKLFLCHFPQSFSPRSQADWVKRYLRKKLGVNKRAKHSSLSLMYWKGWNAKLSHKYEVCDSEYRNKSVVNVHMYHTFS